MIIECFDKGTGNCTLKIEFPNERNVHETLTGYSFEVPHDVRVDGKQWGVWHYALVVPATLEQLPKKK
jgi:hypothetical protein